MNDSGIFKIYFIKQNKCSFRQLPAPGTTIDLTGYLSDSLTGLEFEPDSFSKDETTETTPAGIIFNSVAGFTISGINPENDSLVKTLTTQPHIFIFADVEGQYLMMGTASYKPRFSYKQVNNNPPNPAKNYRVTVSLQSPHGFIFCTIP